jgi:hypothetical protein
LFAFPSPGKRHRKQVVPRRILRIRTDGIAQDFGRLLPEASTYRRAPRHKNHTRKNGEAKISTTASDAKPTPRRSARITNGRGRGAYSSEKIVLLAGMETLF